MKRFAPPSAKNIPKRPKVQSKLFEKRTPAAIKPTGTFTGETISIASWNVNGIRAISKRDSFKEFIKQEFDILCFNETKLQDN